MVGASAHTFEVNHSFLCEHQLVGSRGKIFRQIEELNPALKPAQDDGFTEIYLILKSEEWKYGAIPLDAPPRLKPLPTELIQHLSETFSNEYVVDVADLNTFTQFYLNSLRGIYSRAVRLYKDEFIASVAGQLNNDQKQMALTFFDLTFAPKHLDDRELPPETAARLLRDQPWRHIDWPKMMTAAKQWVASSPEWTQRAFYRWLTGHQDLGFSAEDSAFFARAVDQASLASRSICCLSEGGCVDCPANRHFRRPQR